MYSNISDRKKYVDNILLECKNNQSLVLSQEIMSMCYVLACSSIEYMVEDILLTWSNEITKLHKNSKRYAGKKQTEFFLKVTKETIESKLKKFRSSDFSKIQELLNGISGNETKDKFNNLIDNSTRRDSINKSILGTKLQNIIDFRNRIAHGQTIPNEESPNLDELKKDYDLIYKHLIRNLIKSLPRPKIK